MSDTEKPYKQILDRAYNLKNREETLKLYEDWAETYDETMVDGLNYSAPQNIATLLANHCQDKSALVADVGCGTGLTGQAAYDKGYHNLVGLDFSDKMLAEAQQRAIYSQLINVDLTKQLDIASDHYDAAISSGIFTYGHLNADCLPEIFRVIRPGGLFICVVRLQVWQELGFAEAFTKMQEDRQISLVAEQQSGNYKTSTEPDGRYLVFRKN